MIKDLQVSILGLEPTLSRTGTPELESGALILLAAELVMSTIQFLLMLLLFALL